jgi:uncharacterized coiled-coil protein SlyX
MAQEDLQALAAKLQELREAAKGTVQNESVAVLADLALLLVQEVGSLEERIGELEQRSS